MGNYQVGSSAYLASSLFLLRRPLLPWTKPKSMGPPPVTFIGQPRFIWGFHCTYIYWLWSETNSTFILSHLQLIVVGQLKAMRTQWKLLGRQLTCEWMRSSSDSETWSGFGPKCQRWSWKRIFIKVPEKRPNFALKSWSVNPRVHPPNIWLNLSCIVQMWQLFYNNGPDLHNRGAEMLELDVHLSKDEHVVVAHDQVPKISPLFIASCSTSRTYSVWLARLWASGRGG